MKRKILPILLSIILVAGLMSCASDTAWRKATVTTYELIGDGVGSAKDTTIALNAMKIVSDAQLAKAKDLYNKIQKVYVVMGDTLKAAGKAESVAKKDELLTQYGVLLKEFTSLSSEIYALVKDFKK